MYKFCKRLLDITISGLAILLLSPLIVPIIVVLLCTGDHDVFYGQKRIGLHNGYFRILKFVTMVRNAETMAGGMHTTQGDPRVTRFGRFLRKTKLNELPQVFNIFLGDMSIVGPRPQVDETFAPFSDEVKAKIYSVRPGLTGLGSLVFRDEEKILSECTARGVSVKDCYNLEITPHKGALEMWYLQHISFWTDVKLIMATAWAVVFPDTEIAEKWFAGIPKRDPCLRVR